MTMLFKTYIGIDYSGAKTAASRNKGLRVFKATLDFAQALSQTIQNHRRARRHVRLPMAEGYGRPRTLEHLREAAAYRSRTRDCQIGGVDPWDLLVLRITVATGERGNSPAC
jgi:hypothetical protein